MASEQKEHKSVWMIVGTPGSGKTTIFNQLTGLNHATSSGVNAVTTYDQMVESVLHPSPTVEGDCYLIDAEGSGSAGPDGLKALAKNIGPIIARFGRGASGVLFCIKAGDRLTVIDQFILGCLSQLGNVRVIICFTKCDLQDSIDHSVEFQNIKRQLLEILPTFNIETYCKTSKNDVSDLRINMRVNLDYFNSDEIKTMRSISGISEGLDMTNEQFNSAMKGAAEVIRELKKTSFMTRLLRSIPFFGALVSILESMYGDWG